MTRMLKSLELIAGYHIGEFRLGLPDGHKFAVVADRIDASSIMDAERVPEWLD